MVPEAQIAVGSKTPRTSYRSVHLGGCLNNGEFLKMALKKEKHDMFKESGFCGIST